ncbi:FMN-dependent NADH-azoreductase [Shimazuella kribbensis]|uniref:FMN-dependent NADH-azoreductase n=1 Tax=Shimazuella kribbensis TaxID=139808 RepID=UPI0003F8CA1C|nr:NAD(P)H-dependent oxidoreductase [Shimazuella kribbensis]
MKKVLYITANPKPIQQSLSLQIGKAFIEEYQHNHPKDEITRIDVFHHDIPLVDEEILEYMDKTKQGWIMDQFSPPIQNKMRRFNRLTEQFIDTDLYVFVFPMWNFGIPPLLKAYVDTFKVARKTFQYTPNGPIGLLNNKQAVLIQSRGDQYSSGINIEYDHSVRYLQSVLSFIGVEQIETIIAEGTNLGSVDHDGLKQEALQQAIQIARSL